MIEPVWSAGARARIAGRPLVLVGIGIDQIRGFVSAGGRVLGGISVLPSGSPVAEPVETFPVLTLTSTTRDILEHVVWAFAATMRQAASELAKFLDRVDPDHTATIAGYLPLPHECLGGRAAWIVDSAISFPLERKAGAETPLSAVVPVIPTAPLPEGSPADWWDVLCSEMDADRLVVQAAGISGGGTGTFVCTSAEQVPELVAGFVAPFVEGLSGNAMGVVDDEGTTAVFPASRQLLRPDRARSPAVCRQHHRRAVGPRGTGRHRRRRARRRPGSGRDGFFGPFGVDFIRRADGQRLYHDLNPRMNGVIDSLSRLIDSAVSVPLVSVVHSRPRWRPDELSALEEAVHDAAGRSPMARLWLTTTVEHPRVIASVPAAGPWWVDPTKATVSPAGDGMGTGGGAPPGAQLAELQPTLPAGLELRHGDRLVLGNLYCDVGFAERTNETTGPALVDAFLA